MSGTGTVGRVLNLVRSVFGRPERQTPRYARPAVEGLEDRLVPSLSPVNPGAGFPFTSNVQIRVTFPDHQSFAGSGVIVDNFHVLTAGHVIYHAADGGFATSIKVIPELNGTSEPFGYAWGTYERTFKAFTNADQAHPSMAVPGNSDVGLITLDRDVGKRTGAMVYGWDPTNAVYAAGTFMNTAGYPVAGGFGGLQMEFSSGPIEDLSRDGSLIQYAQSSITTLGGQSGSPVWAKFKDGSRTVYGVVQGTDGVQSTATRITQPIFNALQSWRSSDRDPGRDWVSTDSPGNTFVSTQGGKTTVFTFVNQHVETDQLPAGPSVQHASLDVEGPGGQDLNPATPDHAHAALSAIGRTLVSLSRPGSSTAQDQGTHAATNTVGLLPAAAHLEPLYGFHSTPAADGTDADAGANHAIRATNDLAFAGNLWSLEP